MATYVGGHGKALDTVSMISVASSWSGPSGVYDFLSEDNYIKWKGLLQPGLSKIQKQVQPRLEIDEDALTYLEGLIFKLLAQLCAAQPHTSADVELYVRENFATPIDTWALSDAKMLMERAQKKKVHFVFPVDKMFPQLQREVFGYKIELNLVQFIMAILDYVSADILKLAGNFVKNARRAAVYINSSDIHVSMSADPALQALFQPLQGGQREPVQDPHSLQPSQELKSLSYDDLLREILDDEKQYIRHLNLILMVFMEPFLKQELFPVPEEEVQQIVGNLQELHEISAQLVGSLEECIEMSAEETEKGAGLQAGFIFEEIAETLELEAYIRYAENYMMAKTRLEELVDHSDMVEYFKSQPTNHLKEAMKYILPKSLDEPCYHCFHYFDAIESLIPKCMDEEDREALESASSSMLGLKMEMESVCSRFLKKRSREENGMFIGKRKGYKVVLKKLAMIQQKIEGWEGPEIASCCTEFIMEGALGVMKEGSKKSSSKNDRHVFLLDGLIICCRTRSRGGVGEAQYRLKEKINMRKAKLTDLEDTDDIKFAFTLQDQFQTGLVFYAISKIEKNDWMALLTHLLTRSTFDRLIDIKLREEEKTIPTLRPPPAVYKFAEEDEGNILFDEKDSSSMAGGHGPLIKAGTIHKLVERLTYHEYADPTFVRTFLMTYRSFCQPAELLDLLIYRYQIPSPLDSDDTEARRDPLMMKALKRCKDNYIYPIQLRVLNVLRLWVELHYYDFERNPEILQKLKDFVGGVKSKKLQQWVNSIHRFLQKGPSAKPVVDKYKEPEPVEWYMAKPNDINEYSLLTLHPTEIARQLTLIQAEYFNEIHPSELVDASWMKEQKKETASPNLLRLNRFETTVSNWLSEEIVFSENFDERVALVSRLVDIMEALLNLNNFAGMFVVNAALESASVFRLKHTMRAINTKRQTSLEYMKKIASSEKGFKKYKETLRKINPPCIPFLGMYMTYIVFIKDGNEDKIQGMPDHFINFKKRRRIADVLHEIHLYQNTLYCLTPEPSIQKFIKSQDPVGDMPPNQWEDKLFDQSRSIEPKEGPYKAAPRKYPKLDLRGPQESKTGTMSSILRKKPQHAATLPHPLPSEHQLNTEGIEQSPKSPTSPNFQSHSNGMSSPRKYSADSSTVPRRPPKPPSMSTSSNGHSASLSRQSSSSPAIGSSEPPPIPERIPPPPPREPILENPLPLPPKSFSTTPRRSIDGPPLPPRESTPTAKSPRATTFSPRNDGPPLPPRNEGTPSTPARSFSDSPTFLPRNTTPELPPRENQSTTPSRSLRTRDSKPHMDSAPPLPPRGS